MHGLGLQFGSLAAAAHEVEERSHRDAERALSHASDSGGFLSLSFRLGLFKWGSNSGIGLRVTF